MLIGKLCGRLLLMSYATIQLAYDAGVAAITLNRPDKRNAISFQLVSELMSAFDEIERSSAQVVILDEPTAALGVAQTEQVLALVKRLAERGVGVLMISHNLVDVFQVADYINVLYLGQMVASVETSKTTSDDVVGYITGSKTYTGAAV